MSYEIVDMWYAPQEILESICKTEISICEMSKEDLGFLCGIIRDKKPRKVVEIGVAEGGTTSVVMNAIEMLELGGGEFYSIDLNETLFYNEKYKTGCIYNEVYKNKETPYRHSFLFGKTIAGQIEKIGKGIDLAIIDTTHVLPGEILDYICLYPYLTEGAIVVFHDVNLNYIRSKTEDINLALRSEFSVSTKILFGACKGKKYLNIKSEQFPNIAAVQVTKDSCDCMDCFWMLGITWNYRLSKEVADEYAMCIKKNYDDSCYSMFKIALKNNNSMYTSFTEKKRFASLEKNYEKLRRYIEKKGFKKIAIYGLGWKGKRIYAALKQIQANVVCGIDAKVTEYDSLTVYASYDEAIDCDVVIVTIDPIKNAEFIEKIKKSKKCIMIDDLLETIVKEREMEAPVLKGNI